MTPPLPEPTTSTSMAPITTSPFPLFKGDPTALEVRQQRLTNCPLPAVLAALAHACPRQVQQMIIKRDAPTKSWFYNKPLTSLGYFDFDSNYIVKFQHKNVDVTPLLYLDGGNRPRFGKSTTGSGWVSYIEKAYVGYRGRWHYENLDLLDVPNPVLVERVMEDIVFEFDSITIDGDRRGMLLQDLESASLDPPEDEKESFGTLMWQTLDRKQMRRFVRKFLGRAGRLATVATTDSQNPIHSTVGLVGNHTYAVLNYSSRLDKIRLFDAMHGSPVKLTLRQFISAMDNMYQARGHGPCS